jgi:putative aldouronate transport system substrate-binding protein
MRKIIMMIVFACLIGTVAFSGAAKDQAGLGGPVKIEIVRAGSGLPAADKDIILQELNRKLNLDITFIAYPSDYNTQINTRIASGSYPDLFLVDKVQLKTFAEKGLLLDLTDYYKKDLLPVAEWLGDSIKMGMSNGKYYGLTRPVDHSYFLDFIRKDWLDRLNLKKPESVDDLYNIARAFTYNDPDGNGKDDTFGITGLGIGAFASIFGSFGVGLNTGFPYIYVKDGNLVSSVTDPDVIEAINAAKRFIDAGVVDPELIGNRGLNILLDKASQGKVGIVRSRWSDFLKDDHVKMLKAGNSDAEWIWNGYLKNGNRTPYNGTWDISTPTSIFSIPTTLAKNNEKLNGLFQLLNYISKDEGFRLVQYGIEGKNYRINNGNVESIDFGNIGHIWFWQFLGRDEGTYLSVRFPNQKEVIDFSAREPRVECLNGFVDYPEGFVASDVATFAEQEIIKFLYGQRPISEYRDFLETLMGLYKFREYMDNAKIQLAKQNFLK